MLPNKKSRLGLPCLRLATVVTPTNSVSRGQDMKFIRSSSPKHWNNNYSEVTLVGPR